MRLEVKESGDGRLLIEDADAGHRFEYRLLTEHGIQVLGAMKPVWRGGDEPPDAPSMTIEATALAEREATDLGWIEGEDPEVG